MPGTPTGRALITVSDDGENTIVVVPGSNARVDSAGLPSGTIVLAQLEIPVDAVTPGVRRRQAPGCDDDPEPGPGDRTAPRTARRDRRDRSQRARDPARRRGRRAPRGRRLDRDRHDGSIRRRGHDDRRRPPLLRPPVTPPSRSMPSTPPAPATPSAVRWPHASPPAIRSTMPSDGRSAPAASPRRVTEPCRACRHGRRSSSSRRPESPRRRRSRRLSEVLLSAEG